MADQSGNRRVLIYFAWSRSKEADAPLESIDDRFPAIFELRRLFYPRFEEFADPGRVDQGIRGFLDHIQKPNFAMFAKLCADQTGQPTVQIERFTDDECHHPLSEELLAGFDTVIVITFDSLTTTQVASATEISSVRRFLASPNHLIAICPHHDIGEAADIAEPGRAARRLAEHLHHGDKASPPRQGFGGFARSLLAGLGVPVVNRFGLRPAAEPDGRPAPLIIDRSLDRLGLLEGVRSFNLHPHLPQLERLDGARDLMDVLARQPIDLSAPPHPFAEAGRQDFDGLLQSRSTAFAGTVLVSDTTLWSSTAGGLSDLQRFWSNVLQRADKC